MPKTAALVDANGVIQNVIVMWEPPEGLNVVLCEEGVAYHIGLKVGEVPPEPPAAEQPAPG